MDLISTSSESGQLTIETSALIHADSSLIDAVYKIYRWDVAHCHPLHKPEHLCYLRSFREVNEVQGQFALINSKVGMSMRTSYEVMGQGVGGTENLPFRFSDLKNYLMTIRQKEMVVGEATVIQEFFRNEALSKPSFYYDIQVDAAEDIFNGP